MRDFRATLNTVGWTLAAFSALFVAARTFTRTNISASKLGADDWCMIVGWVFAIACTALVTVGTKYGFGQHMVDIEDPEHQAKAAMYVLIAPTVSIASAFFTKASIIIGLMRIIGRVATWVHKTIAYTPLVILLVLSVLSSCVMIFFCSPIQKSWRPYLPGECLDTNMLNAIGKSVSGAYNAFMDVCCAVVPIILIQKLNIARKDKRSLILLMSGSIFGTFATIMKIVAMSSIANVADITHAWSEITIWYLTENHILIIAGSCPALRPLWRVTISKYSSYLSSNGSKNSKDHSQSKHGTDQLVSLQTIGHKNKDRKMPNLFSTTIDGDSQEDLCVAKNKTFDEQSLEHVLVNHGCEEIGYQSEVTQGQIYEFEPAEGAIQITTTTEVKVV